VSPSGGGEGEDGKRGDRKQEAGDRRQEAGDRRQEAENRRQKTGDNFKPLLTMCKTSTPGPSGHPRQRGTVSSYRRRPVSRT